MSKKGCSPDNASCEGLFGRMQTESKNTLGGLIPVQYRLRFG